MRVWKWALVGLCGVISCANVGGSQAATYFQPGPFHGVLGDFARDGLHKKDRRLGAVENIGPREFYPNLKLTVPTGAKTCSRRR